MSISFPTARIYRAVSLTSMMILTVAVLMYFVQTGSSEIADTAGSHASEDVKAADTIKIARYAEEHPDLVKEISETFKQATDTVAVIEEVERVGATLPITLLIDKADINANEGDRVLALALTASGGWNDLYRFVARLDVFPYVHETTKISFTKVQASRDAPLSWKVTVEMNVPLMQQ